MTICFPDRLVAALYTCSKFVQRYDACLPCILTSGRDLDQAREEHFCVSWSDYLSDGQHGGQRHTSIKMVKWMMLLVAATHFLCVESFCTPPLTLRTHVASHNTNHGGLTTVRMGLFDAIGKALKESLANDETLGDKPNPGFRVQL